MHKINDFTKKRIAIVSTHPIQYYAPLFQTLALQKELEIKVFYTWGNSVLKDKYDPDFGRSIEWDIPLLSGYNYHFTKNTAKQPGSSHFGGIVTPDLIKEVTSFEADAILMYGYAYQGHLKLMRHFKGKTPIWFRGDSTLLDEKRNWKSILKKIYLFWIYHYIDKALYVGTNNKAYFLNYGIKAHQLQFVPHAIDNERFAVDRKEEADVLRKKLGLTDKDLLILYAGKLEEKKNPQLLLNAFMGLAKEHVHLLFVGNGVLEDSLKVDASTPCLPDRQPLSMTSTPDRQSLDGTTSNSLSRTTSTPLSRTNRIHFMDFQNQSQMPVVYQACDLFCLPSKGPGETWGLAVNEAMAAGKAILVSDKVGCSVDLVKDGENGYIFKSEDLNDLSVKLKQLMETSTLKKMGQRSKDLLQEWTLQKQVNNILALFK